MEDVSDALKMMGAMAIFIVALSLTMYVFTRVRQTSAKLLSQDKTNTYYNTSMKEFWSSAKADPNDQIDKNILMSYDAERIVSAAQVVTQLYTYYNTHDTIIFYKGHLERNGVTNVRRMSLYNSAAIEDNLEKSFLRVNPANKTDTEICGLDTYDEQLREEPWNATKATNRKFVDDLVYKFNDHKREATTNPALYYTSRILSAPDVESKYIWYNKGQGVNNRYSPQYGIKFNYFGDTSHANNLISNTSARFIERIGTYTINPEFNQGGEDRIDKKFYDADTKLVGNEDEQNSIKNPHITEKRIIQYILLD